MEKNSIIPGTLYLVATPIGNMSDISERALKVLNEVTFIAAEDTRNTGLLLSRLGISKPLISYHEYNKAEKGRYLLARLQSNESCALVTDAGTPAISDPGADIVKLCIDNNINVTGIPGPCAAINSIILSGLDTKRFVFEGFLPLQNKERKERLEEIKKEYRTVIIYEAPHKLIKTLEDFRSVMEQDRKIVLCREMTKINEEIIRTTVSGTEQLYKDVSPKGEYVIILEGCKKERIIITDPEEEVEKLISSGMKKMDAIKQVAKMMGVPKNEIYLKINKESDEKDKC